MLSVVTWNVWFDRFAFHIRRDMILETLWRLSPDVICLQEVLPSFLPPLCQSPWCDQYDMSDDGSGSSLGSYGVLTLCKKKLHATFRWHPFPTRMGRQLLCAEMVLLGTPTLIGNVHLESLANHPTREEQLKVCQRQLEPFDNAILCGDFNFCSYRNFTGTGPLENDCLQQILPDFVDVWPLIQPGEKGYTFDSEVNTMLMRPEQMRYDRVLFRTHSKRLQPQTISILGNQSATTETTNPRFATVDQIPTHMLDKVFPSDHFGLKTEFYLNKVCEK